jgi:hypothetical protein
MIFLIAGRLFPVAGGVLQWLIELAVIQQK